jgi:predicted phosphate transport protein (TIGR00153 family)
MGTFSKIFGSGDKKLQKQAEECLLRLSKYLQSASAKMRVTAKLWVKGEHDKLDELEEEIIELERKADRTKEHLVEKVLAEHAFLPQQTEERHSLALHMDAIIDAAEDAVRMMVVGKGMKPAEEILDIAEKCWICTDYLQDSVKYLFKDFKKSVEVTRKVDHVREEARDLQYKLLKRLFRDPDCDYKPTEVHFYKSVSERVLDVAIKAELAADFIRELAIKYS